MAFRSVNDMAPHADEYAEGHLGRIAILNGFKSTESCLIALGSQIQPSGRSKSSLTPVEALANFAELDSRAYMKLHTLLAFSCFAVDDKKRTDDGGWSRDIQFRNGLRRVRNGAFFCVACVKEDTQFRGYSYWRRTHQLPGMFWCDKHPEGKLLEVGSENPFGRLPQNWIDDSETKCHDLTPDTQLHPMVNRFNECCQTMLDSGRSRNSRVARRPMSNIALLAGLNVHYSTQSNEYPRLSDVVGSIFPTEWVRAIAPYCLEKEYGEFFSVIDSGLSVGNPTNQTLGTAFALTLIFDSMRTAFISIDTMSKSMNNRPDKMSRAKYVKLVDTFKINPKYSLEKFNSLTCRDPVSA